MMAADIVFAGVTPMTGSPQAQHLVTFSLSNTTFNDQGALAGVASGYTIEALSRDPNSNILYGFAVNGAGSGQVYQVNPQTAQATPLGTPVAGGFAAGPDGFYASGTEHAYAGGNETVFDAQGVVTGTIATSGTVPVAQAAEVDVQAANPPANGITLDAQTYTNDGASFTVGTAPAQTFASTAGLQVAGPFSTGSEYVAGSIANGNSNEYDLFTLKIADGTTTKVATLPQALDGFADLSASPYLRVTGLAGPITAGTQQQFTVTAYNADGSVNTGYTGTVHISSNDGRAVLPANSALTNGTGTFNVTPETAGTLSLTATDTATASDTGSEAGIKVVAAAANRLAVTGATNEAAGGVEHVTVTAFDPYGNVATGYAGMVHITSSDAQAVLPADATLANGVGTFNVTLKTAGTQSITATDAATATITGNQGGIVVSPAAAAKLVVTGATGEVAGGVEKVTVTALDMYGNVATGYAGTVHLTSSDGRAILQADSTLTNGVGTFNVTLETAGTESITATDAATATITGTEGGIVVTPAAAAKLTMTGAVGEVAGGVEKVTVTALDMYGNVATGYAGTVHITSSDAQAVLPPNAMLTSGVGTFDVTLKTAGTESITATDAATPALTATDAGIVVSPAKAAAKFTIAGAIDEVAGGVEHVTVTAYDMYGNVDTGYAGTVHVTSSDAQAVLPADATLTNGVGAFDITLKTAGTESITAADASDSGLTATDAGIVVTPAAAAKLTMTGATDETAGGVEHITVTAFDMYGNVATGYAGTVHVTSSDAQAILPADSPLTKGTAQFDVTLWAAGTESITATDTSDSSLTATQAGLVVTPATAAKLVMTGATDEVAGGVEKVTVTAYDMYGNVATGYAGTVHVTSSDAQAVLPADAMLANGVGTFDVTLETAGTQSITATDAATPALTATDSAISVTPAAAAKLTLTGASDEVAGGAETVTVTAYDMYGNVATGYAGTIDLTGTDPHATFPATVTSTAGVAQFTFTPTTAGTETLTAKDSADATVAGSATIKVTPASAGSLVVSGAPGGVAGSVEQVTLTVYDAFGNVATGFTGAIHLSSSDAGATLPADFTLTDGTATVPVTLVKAGTDSITATAAQPSSLTGSETGIAVTPAATTRFVIAGPTTTIAGQAQTYTIAATDAYGNATPGYAGTVRFASSDPSAVLPASITLGNGSGSFSATLESAGSQSITATDPTSGATGSLAGIATTAMLRGMVYLDSNASGTLDAGEAGMAGRVVYLDLAHAGAFVAGDPTATTDAAGHFAFPGVAAGSATVLEDTTQDTGDRYVVDQTTTAADGSLAIGATPFSAIAPLPVVPNPFAGNAGSTANAAYVQSLYKEVLGRSGSDAEVAGWVAAMTQGMAAEQVVAQFINSPEHRSDQVAAYYREFLHRAADPASIGWVNDLMAGVSEEAVVEGIVGSPEYLAAHQDNSLLVRDLYIDVLGRQATTAELANSQAAMAAGATPQAVIAAIVTSPEANDQIVDSLYATGLRRVREAGTSDIWTTMLASGDSASAVAVGILGSAEFQQEAKVAATS